MQSGIKYVSSADGANIAYEADGSGPPLLYVRGWISNLELQRLDPAIERLFAPLREHRTVIRYDGRGNGLSDWELPNPITYEDLVADLDAVISTIDAPTFDIWATTYGGPLAIDYIARHPERINKVVLDGTYANGRTFTSPEQAETMFELLAMATVSPDVVFSSLSFMSDPDPLMTHEARVARMRKSISAAAVEPLYRLAYEYDVEELLPLVTPPTLLLHRSDSRAVTSRSASQLAASIPNATLRLLDGAAHNLYEGDWETALSAIADFLEIPISVSEPIDDESRESEVVVLLFTDIAGSTAMTTRAGDDDAQHVLRTHNRIVRAAVENCAGTEVKHTGDGILATFRGVIAATQAAISIANQVEALPVDDGLPRLAIKMGINAGEPLAESGDLYGSSVQIAARVCDVAGENEIVVTEVVRELLRGKQQEFESLGAPSLKGIDDPIPLWRLLDR